MNKSANALVTYGQLSEVLTQLGFTRMDTAEYVAFHNVTHDALLAFPVTSPEQTVDVAHLAATRATVTGSGVASENTLAHLLAQIAARDSVFVEAMPQHSEAA